MNKQREHMSCSEALSLLTLRTVLTGARRDVPPHVATHDRDEALAAEAIEKMKRQYKRYLRSIPSVANRAGVEW